MVVRWRRRRAEQFDEVLARCLTLLEAGESLESCLAQHPAHAARLEPALRTALTLRSRLAAEPDPAFVQRARERMLAAAARRNAPAPPPEIAQQRGWLRLPSMRPLATAGAALTLVAVAAVPVAATTSADALPGEWNYGIKRGTERVLLALNFTDHLALADERAEEVRELAERGKYDQLVSATRAYEAELRNARRAVDPDAVSAAEARKVEERVTQQQAQLAAAGEAVQEQQAQRAAAQPGSTPPPAIIEAQQATQSALNTAAETRQDIQQVAAAAQARATASPSASASPSSARTATPATATASPAATVTAAGSASPQPGTGTPSGQTPGLAGTAPAGSTAVTIAGSPSATPEASATPALSATPAPVASRPPEPSPTPEPSPVATRAPQPAAAATSTPVAAATRAPQPPATAAPAPTAAATRGPQPASPSPTPVDDSRPRPAATPEPSATPAARETPRASMLELQPGQHTLVYNGPSAPVDLAFAALSGKIAWIEWTPPGASASLRYSPGDRSRFVILTGSTVTIFVTDGIVIPAGALTAPTAHR